MNGPTHDCAAPGCGVQCAYEMLACRPHWYRLPADLRNRITGAWRSVGVRGAERYLAVRAEAVTWWRENAA